MLKYSYFTKLLLPFYKNKFYFSAVSRFFPYSQQLKEPRKMGLGGLPLTTYWKKREKTRENLCKKRALFFCL